MSDISSSEMISPAQGISDSTNLSISAHLEMIVSGGSLELGMNLRAR